MERNEARACAFVSRAVHCRVQTTALVVVMVEETMAVAVWCGRQRQQRADALLTPAVAGVVAVAARWA